MFLPAARKKILVLALVAGLIGLSIFAWRAFHKPVPIKYQQLQLHSGKRSLTVAIAYPKRQENLDGVLVVYLHGLGQTHLEPFLFPGKYSFAQACIDEVPGVTFASCEFGKPGLFAFADFDDITFGIRELLRMTASQRIVLAGSSLGACTAMSYSVYAPADIRDKLVGVDAIYPCGDILALEKSTSSPFVKAALQHGLGGTPQQSEEVYKSISLLHNLAKFPKQVRVYVISARRDTVIPPNLQKDIVEALTAISIPVSLETIDCPHEQPPKAASFVRGLNYVLTANPYH